MSYNNHIVITDLPEKAAVELLDLASFSNLKHFERNDSKGGISKVEHWDDVGICHDIYWFADPTAPLDKVRGLTRLKSVQYMVTPQALKTEEWDTGYHDVIVPLRNQYGATEIVMTKRYPLYYPSFQQLQQGAAALGTKQNPFPKSSFMVDKRTGLQLGFGDAVGVIGSCNHDWEEKLLFTGIYYKCRNCGKETNERF